MTTTTRAFRAIAIRDGLSGAISDCMETGQPIPLTRETVEGEGWGDRWDTRGRERLYYEIDSQLGVPASTLASQATLLLQDVHDGRINYGQPRRIQQAPYNADITVYGSVMWPEDEESDAVYVDYLIAPTGTDPSDIVR